MTISIDELVRQLATLGVVETAVNGSFHDLPGSGGGGTSNVRMIRATVTKAPGPDGFGSVIFNYGYDAPIEGPFVQVVEAILSDNVEFSFTFYPDSNGTQGMVSAIAKLLSDGQPTDTEWPKDILIRVEPFEETV